MPSMQEHIRKRCNGHEMCGVLRATSRKSIFHCFLYNPSTICDTVWYLRLLVALRCYKSKPYLQQSQYKSRSTILLLLYLLFIHHLIIPLHPRLHLQLLRQRQLSLISGRFYVTMVTPVVKSMDSLKSMAGISALKIWMVPSRMLRKLTLDWILVLITEILLNLV
ncbi:hypothetical protein BT96DRAFT_950037 [Gymnopus androsaceus JB14]|uniref:Uncharacterized protein n=1 Tax=Gymnopus androsaceus JB14 TaxID=1447944 RepID=A0A6A4GHP5_9AGAR|nr:hypothetical protein BT96DRAFT_950037 [Gymnopus androsaceus JB14]